MTTLEENQTPEPNILGYLVLAAFGAAGLWAITRPRTAEAATACPPATRERLGLYHSTFDVSVAWFPERTTPPEAEVLADGRVRFPTARALIEGTPEPTPLAQPVVVVVGSNDQFWRYEGQPGQQVTPRLSGFDRESYCTLIRERNA